VVLSKKYSTYVTSRRTGRTCDKHIKKAHGVGSLLTSWQYLNLSDIIAQYVMVASSKNLLHFQSRIRFEVPTAV